jgi:hypothetical protein
MVITRRMKITPATALLLCYSLFLFSSMPMF